MVIVSDRVQMALETQVHSLLAPLPTRHSHSAAKTMKWVLDSPCWAGNARPSASPCGLVVCLREEADWQLDIDALVFQAATKSQLPLSHCLHLPLQGAFLPAGLPGGAGMRPYVVLDGQ